jgi:small neutral amino acid transporter SnatA (MarC family)
MEVFKFSATAMSLAGGLILLIYSIRSILAEEKKETRYATDREAEQMAIYPLAVPLMASVRNDLNVWLPAPIIE